jgi:hypothetical protein
MTSPSPFDAHELEAVFADAERQLAESARKSLEQANVEIIRRERPQTGVGVPPAP